MKQQSIIRFAAVFVTVLLGFAGFAQVTVETNTNGNNTDFVGWDNTNNFDLQIRHDGNKNIQFHTNGNERMRIASTGRVGIGTTNPGSGILTIENTSTSLGVEVGVVITLHGFEGLHCQ